MSKRIFYQSFFVILVSLIAVRADAMYTFHGGFGPAGQRAIWGFLFVGSDPVPAEGVTVMIEGNGQQAEGCSFTGDGVDSGCGSLASGTHNAESGKPYFGLGIDGLVADVSEDGQLTMPVTVTISAEYTTTAGVFVAVKSTHTLTNTDFNSAGETRIDLTLTPPTWQQGTGSDFTGNGAIIDGAFLSLDMTDAETKLTNISEGWHLECVACPKEFKEMTDRSLQLDANDRPHVVYGGDRLYYSWLDGHTWRTEIPDPDRTLGSFASLALDSSDNPHIVYYDAHRQDLKYATKQDGEWQIMVVDSNGEVGKFTSMALDSLGKPHVSYFDDTNDNIKYATLADGEWQSEVVNLNGKDGGTSLAIDSHDNPHIFYINSQGNMYSRKYFGSWITELVDGHNYSESSSSLVLDSNNIPHIIYVAGETLRYRYRQNMGGQVTWFVETVESTGMEFTNSVSLAIDSQGTLHASYDFGGHQLKHAQRGDSHNWMITSIVTTSNVGQWNSITVDSVDYPHISYFDSNDHDMRYVAGRQPSSSAWQPYRWQHDVVSDGDNIVVGEYANLILAHGQDPVIVANSGNQIRTFLKIDNGWSSELVTTISEPRENHLFAKQDGDLFITFPLELSIEYRQGKQAPWVLGSVPSIKSQPFGMFVIGSDNIVHTVGYYSDEETNILTGRHFSEGSWSSSEIRHASGNGIPSFGRQGLAIDTNNNLYTIWVFGNYLQYVSYDSDTGKWGIRTRMATSVARDGFALALNGDKPHMVYYSTATHTLHYRYLAEDGWHDTEVLSGEFEYPDIEVGSDGLIHISYYDIAAKALMYVVGTESQWEIHTVDANSDAGKYASLVLDQLNQPHFTYYDASNGDLRYAAYQSQDGQAIHAAAKVDAISGGELAAWDEVRLSADVPADTEIFINLLDGDGRAVAGYQQLPLVDGTNTIDISQLDTVTYPALQLEVELLTRTPDAAPVLHDWSINWQPTEPNQHQITGEVSNHGNTQVVDAKVELLRDGTLIAATTTDAHGHYLFEGVTPTLDDTYTVRVVLETGVASAENSLLQVRYAANDTYNGPVVSATTPTFTLNPISSLTTRVVNIDFKHDQARLSSNIADVRQLDDIAAIFIETQRALEFSQSTLNATVAPFDVNVFASSSGAFYSPQQHAVVLGDNESGYFNSSRPMNREWHEFFHALQESGTGLHSPECADSQNHGGYDNCSTEDSWAEGFAEFWSVVLWKELGWANPGVYYMGSASGKQAGISAERNWKVWEHACSWCPQREEMAVMSLLWDLYDDTAEYGDDIQLSAADLWTIVGTPTYTDLRDLKDVYDALVAAGVGQVDSEPDACDLNDLDQVFVMHGVFHDVNGDRTYDCSEEVGRAADAGRPGRRSPSILEAYLEFDTNFTAAQSVYAFVHVDYSDVRAIDYTMRMPFDDVMALSLSLEPPTAPEVVTITISAETTTQTSENPFVFTNEQYWEWVNQTSGPGETLQTHTFDFPPYALNFVPGWNLAAFPRQPDDPAIEAVLAPIADKVRSVYAFDGCAPAGQQWRKYDPTANSFRNTLKELHALQGFWIYVTEAVSLPIAGTPTTTPIVSLCAGPNLVGYAETPHVTVADHLPNANAVRAVYSFGDAQWKKFTPNAPDFRNSLKEFRVGQGYWVITTQDLYWAIE